MTDPVATAKRLSKTHKGNCHCPVCMTAFYAWRARRILRAKAEEE